MKNLFTFLTMLFALTVMTVPATAQETETVQVGYGTSRDEGYPIVNWWKCTYQGCENLYLKDELGLNAGDKIVSLSYYCVAGSASGGNFNVRIKNTNKTTIQSTGDRHDSSVIELTYDDTVYGNVTMNSYSAGEWITFNLSEPFIYEGENIIIDIRNTAPANRHGWCYFAGTFFSGDDNRRGIAWWQAKSEDPHTAGFYDYYDSGLSRAYPGDDSFCPNTIFEFIPADPAPVTEFTVNGIHYKTNSNGVSVQVTYSDSSNEYANNYAGMTTANIPPTVTYQGKTYTVTSIGTNAFRNCSSLTSAVIPNTVKFIGSSFTQCINLQNVTIGNSVTTIGNSAFNGCSSLKRINVPNSVIAINQYAFMGCKDLSSVTLGNSLTIIGRSAFNGCESLSSITFPESLAAIGMYAFYGCSSLQTLEIPSSVNSIGEGAFNYCSGISSINVAASNAEFDSRNYCNAIVEKRRNRLIYGCKNTIIPGTVTNIGDEAFIGCTGLSQIVIPASVDTIGTQVFRECSNLNAISVDPDNQVFDSRNNCNAIIETTTSTLLYGCKNTEIPSDVTGIGDFAFCGHPGLTSVSLPMGLTSIGERAFKDCTGLTNVVIPKTVTSIVSYAFVGCNNLEEITINSLIESMGRGAFYNCTSLNKIFSHTVSPKDVLLGSDVFMNVDHSSCVLYVPNGTRNIYMTANQWMEFETMKYLGDVNNDGTINVTDYIKTSSYILEMNPQQFMFAAADLNEDGTIAVGDLIGVAYIALHFEDGAPMLAPAVGVTENPTLAMAADVNGRDGSYEVAINLSNNVDLTALQMDLNLPEGMTLVDVSLSGRATASHEVAFNQLSNGDYRLLASSPACKAFTGCDGAVLTLTLAGEPSGNGIIRNIELATPHAASYKVDDIELNFNNTTGVENMTAAASRIYSDGGNIVIDSPANGTAQIVLPNGMSQTVTVTAGKNIFPAPASGMVIVKMGKSIKKLQIK